MSCLEAVFGVSHEVYEAVLKKTDEMTEAIVWWVGYLLCIQPNPDLIPGTTYGP